MLRGGAGDAAEAIGKPAGCLLGVKRKRSLAVQAHRPGARASRRMPLLSLYINNKAGGLIYHRDFAAHAAKLDVNDHLRLASTFNGLALIMKQLSPVRGSSQMLDLECDGFVLQSFDTLTGLKFFVTADPDSRHLDAVLREVYILYSDYVLFRKYGEFYLSGKLTRSLRS